VRKILIFGATSAIAEATARRFAAKGDALFLIARDTANLAATAEDLRVRGAVKVETLVMDALDYDRHAAAITSASDTLGGLDVALIAHGTLPDQKGCEVSSEATRREIEVNALSTISLLTHLANRFEAQGSGIIAAISSVAGERGRQSNYVYGASKAAVTVFLGGLRNRLHTKGVAVVTIKPGFVDTPMTAHFAKGGPLWASPERVARGIERAILRRRDVVYVPAFWAAIMWLVRAIPERLFKRLKL
jgi:decaprenylphospho-beta-D-erythro-pentofuranosid-2-ulose 2-reductase